MHTEADWMRAIVTDPADLQVRLVFADWLEEQGESDRAEFIRLQVELDALTDMDVSGLSNYTVVNGMTMREWRLKQVQCNRLLSNEKYRKWIPLFGVDVGGPDGRAHGRFRKGFCDRIELPTDAFMEHCADLFRCHPIEEVGLTDRESNHPTEPISSHLFRGWYGLRNTLIDEDDLPPDLWRCMEPVMPTILPVDSGWKMYFTTEEANDALSQACVWYGRRMAGLPELVPVSSKG
jgi:uncharacterized protein (TIGR02996 family)